MTKKKKQKKQKKKKQTNKQKPQKAKTKKMAKGVDYQQTSIAGNVKWTTLRRNTERNIGIGIYRNIGIFFMKKWQEMSILKKT